MARPTLHTRRKFLRTSILGGAVAWTLPAFIDRTFAALDAGAAGSLVQTATGRDGPILVILQLSGGNDGLNTVIPYADDAYHRARPRIGVPEKSVLRLCDHAGLHPRLPKFAQLYGEGHATVLQGVGYPNPNRSHFRSMEIWQTASDADRVEPHGWLGRYFDNCCKGQDPAVGISLGAQMPQAFSAAEPMGIALENPGRFRFAEGSEVMRDAPAESSNDGGSIGALAGGTTSDLDAFHYIERVALDAQVASDRISEIVRRHPAAGNYPHSRLGQDLQLVSQLIAGGMPTRVYYVSIGGFDTHANQAGVHEQLLGQLDDALAAFTADLRTQGNFDRVLLLTFSEFGRRVQENGGGGTDHGTAAPMFLLGGGVRPGLAGSAPSLTDLDAGDLKHTVDFRSVYATLLEKWLRVPGDKVLGRKFPTLGFI
ncbi:MAG: DUF1501 domain-containing protein [Terrimicrobiaceae bacterium]|nr:DUF1501 domain-containing protein [Terrimicrobiaceae bacterium]